MMKLTAGLAAATLAIGPGLGLMAVAAVATPSESAYCIPATPTEGGGGGGAVAPEPPPETGEVVFPLPEGTWVRTDGFGPRDFPPDPFHTGVDFAAADGTPILAVADGIVTDAHYTDQWGGQIFIEHTVEGHTVATVYVHMWQHGIYVETGQEVTAGQHIGDVGSSGLSTGAHLHLEVRPGGTNADPIDPEPWLASNGAIDLGGPGDDPPAPAGCDPETEEDADDDPDETSGTSEGRKEEQS